MSGSAFITLGSGTELVVGEDDRLYIRHSHNSCTNIILLASNQSEVNGLLLYIDRLKPFLKE